MAGNVYMMNQLTGGLSNSITLVHSVSKNTRVMKELKINDIS